MQHIIHIRKVIPLCFLIVSLTEASPQIDKLFGEFKNSTNGYSKIQIIQTLVKDDSFHDENDKTNIEEIIGYGLEDRQASVVQEAIFAAGKFKSKFSVPALRQLYRNGCKMYPGNQSVMRQKIITAFSKIGGTEEEGFFIEELNRKTVCRETEMMLSLLSDKKKCSKNMIVSVISLRDAISNFLKKIENTPENSIRYLQHRTVVSLANTLITKNTQFE